MLDKRRTLPKNFDLDAFIQTNVFHVPESTKPLRLKLRVDRYTANHLREMRLSEDQKIKEEAEDAFVITATVADTGQLRWWLRGYASAIEVLAPKKLRQEMKDQIQEMVRVYGSVL